jgi:prepilin-type N-terminal cleavage/methylation domain-containing protein
MRSERGFTLIELMTAVVIIGVLTVFIIPSFKGMRDRAKEASVKANAHTLQVAAEDFAVRNTGAYAVNETTTLPSGETLPDLLTSPLINPFDDVDATPVIWTGPADADGRVGYDTSADPGHLYVIDGKGEGGITVITLQTGP